MAGSKKGGSQLAQLRSGLRDAGITGSKPKKGKRNNNDDSRIGQYRSQQRRKRLNALMSTLNAFDERVAKDKTDVLGNKVKGSTGRPAAAKSASMQQRREKLLPEYQSRHHSSSFVDRRFGEYDPTMSVEDKMLKRFTHERMNRTSKASMFDLGDDDDSELTLTHYGQSLSGMDELPDVEQDDDYDDENPRGTYECTAAGHDDKRFISVYAVWALHTIRRPCQQNVLLEIAEPAVYIQVRAGLTCRPN